MADLLSGPASPPLDPHPLTTEDTGEVGIGGAAGLKVVGIAVGKGGTRAGGKMEDSCMEGGVAVAASCDTADGGCAVAVMADIRPGWSGV